MSPGRAGRPSRPSNGSALESGASTDQRRRYVWQCQAEHLADSLSKGDRVMDRPAPAAQLGNPRRRQASVTELEAEEVGASLKWATAKVERSSSQRDNGDRVQARERQAERGGHFDDAPPTSY